MKPSPLEIMDKLESEQEPKLRIGIVVSDSDWQTLRASIKEQVDKDTLHLRSTSHFVSLMDGLEIPSPEFWVQRAPSDLYKVGKTIVHQAKRVKELEEYIENKNSHINTLKEQLLEAEKMRAVHVTALSELKAVSDNWGTMIDSLDSNQIPCDQNRVREILDWCVKKLEEISNEK